MPAIYTVAAKQCFNIRVFLRPRCRPCKMFHSNALKRATSAHAWAVQSMFGSQQHQLMPRTANVAHIHVLSMDLASQTARAQHMNTQVPLKSVAFGGKQP